METNTKIELTETFELNTEEPIRIPLNRKQKRIAESFARKEKAKVRATERKRAGK